MSPAIKVAPAVPIWRMLQQTEVQSVLCGHELSHTQALLVCGQRTLFLCSIKLPRVIIADITWLNNPEVCLFLLSFPSSEVGNLSTKPCCASLSAVSATGRAWGLGPEGLVCLFPWVSRNADFIYFVMFYFILFYFFI